LCERVCERRSPCEAPLLTTPLLARRRRWTAPFLDEVSPSCVAYRAQSHLVLLMQGCLTCVGAMHLPFRKILPRRCRRSPPSLSHLSLVVTLSHLSLIVTSAESWHVDTPHTRVPCSGFSCYGPGHCYLALLPRCLLLWLSRCLVSLSRLVVSFIRNVSPCHVGAASSSSHCVLARLFILQLSGYLVSVLSDIFSWHLFSLSLDRLVSRFADYCSS
jgi:hypothetical protein